MSMTNEERKALVGRLHELDIWGGDSFVRQAATQLEADGKRIAELEHELEVLRPQVKLADDQWDAAVDRIAELEALTQKLMGYAGHDDECQIMTHGVWSDPIPCTCGYSGIARAAQGETTNG